MMLQIKRHPPPQNECRWSQFTVTAYSKKPFLQPMCMLCCVKQVEQSVSEIGAQIAKLYLQQPFSAHTRQMFKQNAFSYSWVKQKPRECCLCNVPLRARLYAWWYFANNLSSWSVCCFRVVCERCAIRSVGVKQWNDMTLEWQLFLGGKRHRLARVYGRRFHIQPTKLGDGVGVKIVLILATFLSTSNIKYHCP